jgi:hypothetical protein
MLEGVLYSQAPRIAKCRCNEPAVIAVRAPNARISSRQTRGELRCAPKRRL